MRHMDRDRIGGTCGQFVRCNGGTRSFWRLEKSLIREVVLQNNKPLSIEVDTVLPGTNHSVAVCKHVEVGLLQGTLKGKFRSRGGYGETRTRISWWLLLFIFFCVVPRMIEILFEKVKGP